MYCSLVAFYSRQWQISGGLQREVWVSPSTKTIPFSCLKHKTADRYIMFRALMKILLQLNEHNKYTILLNNDNFWLVKPVSRHRKPSINTHSTSFVPFCSYIYIYIYIYIYLYLLGVARYMYSYRTVTVQASRFGAWGLTTNTGRSPPIQKGTPAILELMCVCAPARSLQLFPYTSRINFKRLLSY